MKNPRFMEADVTAYDSTNSHNRQETAFDDREKLLFREYHEAQGAIPR